MTKAYLRTGEVARLLNVSPTTLRGWEHRHLNFLAVVRTEGGHRRYDRACVLAYARAIAEGYEGEDIIRRAKELVMEERDVTLRERVTAIERQVCALIRSHRKLQAELERLQPQDPLTGTLESS